MCIRDSAKTKLEKLQAAKAQREAMAEDIGGFMFELAEHGESLTEFDDRLWPVSYTHLDVYKRQVLNTPVALII